MTPGTETFQIPAASLNDSHVQSSMAMMIEAANRSELGGVALLGCGKGSEIPVRQLAMRFAPVDCVDLDNDALSILEAQCQQWQDTWHRFRFDHSDLTGLIPQIVPLAQEVVAISAEPFSCLYRLGALLGSAQPDFWKPPSGEKYSLVICSAVLTQLQATVRKRVENVFLNGFPGQASVLSSYEPWRRAVWNFARKLEDAFILHLESLCSSTGIIYLSDTVHVYWLRRSGPELFTTEGTWIATRTSRLVDYLHSWNEILAQHQWDWIKVEAEGPYSGRVYGVQSLIYKAGSYEHSFDERIRASL